MDGQGIFMYGESRTVLEVDTWSGMIVDTSDLVAPASDLAVDPLWQLI